MKSMTGYGEASAEGRWAKVAIQMRSLNHRHLDIQLRVPREYLALEEEIRKILRHKIARGRVELFITRTPVQRGARKLELDEDLLRQYLDSLRRAKTKFGLRGEVDLSLFSNFPELFQIREPEVGEEDEKGLVLRAIESALKELEQSREREGRQLRSDMESQVRHLRGICARLSKEAKKFRLRFKESVTQEETAPEGEMADVATLAFKGDTHEEVVRLQSHVSELARVIRAREPVGKKVDFLLQEIQRELNTISSKAPQLSAVQIVLAGKERVEKIREQVQNVE